MKRILLLIALFSSGISFGQKLLFSEKGRFLDGREAACEISAYDATSEQLFITNAASDSITIVDISDPASPIEVGGIDILIYGGAVNSVVNLNNGYFAAAIEASVKQDSGLVVFFTTAGDFVSQVKVGALPDMLAVTKDGMKLLVANEGEPDDSYTVDPNGSVCIVDLTPGIPNLLASHVLFLEFDLAPSSIPGSLKKPGTTWAQDLEPEYIAVNENSTLAAVVCQESNVFVFIDLTTNSIISYKGLGFKAHNMAGAGFDASNRDNAINIKPWNVKGVYQPDAISTFDFNGQTYWLSANEGDGRDYDGYSSETRIKDLVLDPTAFPNALQLQNDTVLGRLKTFTVDVIGDIDNDNDVDELYSYGARSFSIWDQTGNLVWDSGDQFEQFIATNHADFFNCSDGLASEKDDRSDDKGPEPEAITVGVIGGKTYAFIGLERQGGIFVYDITNPLSPVYENYLQTLDVQNGTMADIAPEGLLFVPASESHTGTNLLIVSNEFSGSTTIYEITENNIGLSEVENNIFSVYPNPTNDLVNIDLNS
ncbi:MAG: hypothetical protein ACI9XP_002152, partial [Lentimonas sp.]